MIRLRARSALLRLVERVAGRFFEGPDPPERHGEEARLFLLMHPAAGPLDWERFATALAATAYREGFVRGLEALERRRAGEDPRAESDADRERHEWSLRAAGAFARELLERGDPAGPLYGVPPERMGQALDELGQMLGTHRVVALEPDDAA